VALDYTQDKVRLNVPTAACQSPYPQEGRSRLSGSAVTRRRIFTRYFNPFDYYAKGCRQGIDESVIM